MASARTKTQTVQLPIHLKTRLQQGHPWVYRDQLAPGLNFVDGTWLHLECGGWRGYGLWDADSPIALRIFSQHQIPDTEWIARQTEAAWHLRAPIRQGATTAYRLIFG